MTTTTKRRKTADSEVAPMVLRQVTLELEGITQLAWSKPIEEKCPAGDSGREWEERNWLNRLHRDGDNVVIPASSVWKSLQDAGRAVHYKKQANYGSLFGAGVNPLTDYVPLMKRQDSNLVNVKVSDVRGDWLFLPADGGKMKGGPRVFKLMPMIPKGWLASIPFVVFETAITEKVFRQVADRAGLMVGIGRHRPGSPRPGVFGRFSVRSASWSVIQQGD